MSLLSQDYVIQVSDRRFMWFEPGGGSARRIDDESNKSVLWAHLNAFAFTGIGNLGVKHRTDLWLASRLAKVEGELPAERLDQAHVFRAIAGAATDYFNGPRISRIDSEMRRHAFVAVGWGRENEQSEMIPHMVRIGNFTAGGPAGDKFDISVERLSDPAEVRVWWDGQTLLAEEQADLQALRSLDPATVEFAQGASYVLGELIRKVSARNDAVGRGLLVTVLPRASISQGEFSGILLAAPAQENRQTFLYVPPDDREGIVYGPTVVSGGAVLTDFMAGSLDAPEAADLKRAVEASQRAKGS